MASVSASEKKLRVLLIPFFATSHIEPFTDLAIRLAAADTAVEATVAVTPANVSVVQSLLERRGAAAVKVATYPFPAVDGLPAGVENLRKAAAADSWRIDAVALSDALMRPVQERLVTAQSPDAIVTDVHFPWNAVVADVLSVPCITFSVIGAFPMPAMRHLVDVDDDDDVTPTPMVAVPRFPGPRIQIPRTELPDFLRSKDYSTGDAFFSVQAQSFGLAMNTSSDLEPQHYCEMYTRQGYVKRAYFLGPLSLALPSSSPAEATAGDPPRPLEHCINWLDAKPSRLVVYLCFGSLAHVPDVQLDELALGLEASGKPFLWVARAAETWTPPEGWEDRTKDSGLLVRAWTPQTAILGHPALGAFVTHCGWNSILETLAAGVPVLTWPMLFEQFIIERLVTEVLGIGERLWPRGAGLRSTRHREHEIVLLDILI